MRALKRTTERNLEHSMGKLNWNKAKEQEKARVWKRKKLKAHPKTKTKEFIRAARIKNKLLVSEFDAKREQIRLDIEKKLEARRKAAL